MVFRQGHQILTGPWIDSTFVIACDRPLVSDYAAQPLSFNRRAANLQMQGDWKKKIHYRIAAGDAIQYSALRDLAGLSTYEPPDRSLFYRMAPFVR
jgi:hypothetical protein